MSKAKAKARARAKAQVAPEPPPPPAKTTAEFREERRAALNMGFTKALNEHITDMEELRSLAKLVLTGRVGVQALDRQTFAVLVEILGVLKGK